MYGNKECLWKKLLKHIFTRELGERKKKILNALYNKIRLCLTRYDHNNPSHNNLPVASGWFGLWFEFDH